MRGIHAIFGAMDGFGFDFVERALMLFLSPNSSGKECDAS